MGLNSESAARIVIDIETAPLEDAADYLDGIRAPSNYRDKAKIDAYVAEKKATELEQAGLDVDLCRVVAIGWWNESLSTPAVAHVCETGTEVELLSWFWRVATDRHLVGFNCIGFDLPVLQRRSLYLGVPMPSIQVSKYRHPQVTDLAQILSYEGMIRMRSLSFYCKRFGINIADPLTGADIATAVKDGRWSDVADHCEADVRKTAHLAAKLGCFRLNTDQPLLQEIL